MSADSDVEKTEPASEQRLTKAREEGQVARSRELNTCFLLLAGAGTLWVTGLFVYDRLVHIMRSGMLIEWGPKTDLGDSREMAHAILNGFSSAMVALSPLFLVLVVVAILSSVALGGLVFSAKALEPKFSRLNPIAGIGRLFSAQTWVELLKTLSKAAVVGGVGALAIKSFLPDMLGLSNLYLPEGLAHGMQIIATICMGIMGSLLLIALIDVPWQLFSHAKKLRMSKDELKREHKESEGDPHVKGRIRQQQREAARRRMMSDVPRADVVVTNPTHYAVALQYDQAAAGAPVVLAKGRGEIAAKIKALAAEHHVPMLEAPPLARALYANTEIGEQIPEALYTAVAQVLAWVFQLRSHHEGRARMPERPSSLPVPAELDPLGESASIES
ncbi:flagellar biosynthesis protein FlhB [Bordetella sp. 15P40C-2]|uniref:flagellar biosynthesis protein FlhB n=1 Tax=Bordetella sp. 15P40C-2 TaxID=2572246 RepID=UPI00132731E3|nr:flagellar biosynthesis protein FlhB [Bordetella sp. 15P40C-2]MVW70018.1 flagellar type III secretion system protein FlhB [Bordetella sp. 15P40C-2]